MSAHLVDMSWPACAAGRDRMLMVRPRAAVCAARMPPEFGAAWQSPRGEVRCAEGVAEARDLLALEQGEVAVELRERGGHPYRPRTPEGRNAPGVAACVRTPTSPRRAELSALSRWISSSVLGIRSSVVRWTPPVFGGDPDSGRLGVPAASRRDFATRRGKIRGPVVGRGEHGGCCGSLSRTVGRLLPLRASNVRRTPRRTP